VSTQFEERDLILGGEPSDVLDMFAVCDRGLPEHDVRGAGQMSASTWSESG
jgi:hypothetical protein